MASHWDVTINPSPPMMTYNELTTSSHCLGADVYLTLSSLYTTRHIPGIPVPYSKAQACGRAVYVTGLPFSFTCQDVAELFNDIAAVENCLALVALGSMHTFRWVIFEEAEGATSAIRLLNGEDFDGQEVRIVMSLAPNRVITAVHVDENSVEIDDEWEETGKMATPEASQQPIHSHPTPERDGMTTRGHEVSVVAVKAAYTTPRKVSDDPGRAVLMTSSARRQRAESGISIAVSPDGESFATTSQSPKISPPVAAATSLHKSQTSDSFSNRGISWANIASRNTEIQKVVIETQFGKHAGLKPVVRSPKADTIRSVNANAESVSEQKRVILLLNLPNNIQLRDISDAVREGSLVKIVFGVNDEDKSRFAGVIFQKAYDASKFYQVLQKEREKSRPNRFRFIVDVCIGESFPINDDIRAMGHPQYATRRLTIVKARFFFMFKEEHLRRMCHKLVPAENVQLIWLYNGGNATIVFSDVASAIKVKKELDRKAAAAGQPGGEPEIWSGLVTTFSKDPSLLPLDDLRTTLHD